MPTQPTPSDVHVNRPLSTLSVAYMQAAAGFVADAAFPNVPVSKQSDLYYTYDRAEWNRDDMKKRAPATESSGSGYTVSTESYYCDQWDHHHDVPDQRRANADEPLQPDREAVMLCSVKAMIRREANWATKYFTTGIWDTNIEGVASGPTGSQVLQWDDAASNPIENVEAQKGAMLEDTGFEPNTLILQYHVWSALKHHPDILDRIKYGQTPGSPAIVTLQAIAALMEIDRILVMKGIYNAAKEGLTESNSFIGGKNALLCYVAPTPGIMIPSAGYTFSWTGLMGSSAMGGRITKFRMDHLKADRVEIEMSFDHKVVAADCGVLFYTIVS
jgi:hypothetical protein